MKTLLVASLLLVSSVSFANTTVDSIKEFSCVADAELDGLVHTLGNGSKNGKAVKILVSVKDGLDVAACADEVSSELNLKLESIFSITPLFVVSTRPVFDAPVGINPPEAPFTIIPVPEVGNDDVFKCLAIGGICD